MKITTTEQTAKFGVSSTTFKGRIFVVYMANNNSNQFLITSTAEGMTWNEPTSVGKQISSQQPTIASLGDALYIVHVDADGKMLLTTSADGANWSESVSAGGQSTSQAPALISFLDSIYVAYVSAENDRRLYVSSTVVGKTWSQRASVGGQSAKFGPALTVFQNRLQMAYIANDETNLMMKASSIDGQDWSGGTKVGNLSSPCSPGFAFQQGSLCLAYATNDSTQTLALTRGGNGGIGWTTCPGFNNQSTKAPPALCVQDFGNGPELTMIWSGAGNQQLHSAIIPETPAETQPVLSPIEMANRYQIPRTENTGSGQHIAVMSMGGPLTTEELVADVAALGVKVNLANITLKQIGTPSATDSSGEAHLDVEIISSICPAAIVTVYRSARTWDDFAAAIDQAVTDGVNIISISWGATESSDSPTSKLGVSLRNAALKGITVTVAAGDCGSADDRTADGSLGAEDNLAHTSFPASSPWVLACGATQPMDNGSEWVWNDAIIPNAKHTGATGGGVSAVFPRPDYQAAIDITNVNNDRTGRILPDVAALGTFMSWKVAGGGGKNLGPNGGTSAVAPFWAAVVAVVNQQRAAKATDNQPLGFFNDHLYSLLTEKPYLLYDVTHGNNKPDKSYPGYSAQGGFDACTGWGTLSVGAQSLIDALVALPDRPTTWASSF